MRTTKINGIEFILMGLEGDDPMKEVYEFNATTEESFEELYKNIPSYIKATAKLGLIVNFYNKGEGIDFSDDNQQKFYPQFLIGGNSRLYYLGHSSCYKDCSHNLCFLRRSDCEEAVKKFFHIYEDSRNK